MSQTRRLDAILAADMAGYSRLMGADEEGALELPSAKYSCSGSPLRLAKGSTAIDGLSGSGSARLPSPASLALGPLSRTAQGCPRNRKWL